jgi:hypothetical protein
MQILTVTVKCHSQASNNTLSEHKSETLLQAGCLVSQLHVTTNIIKYMNIFETLFILYTIYLTNKIQYLLILILFYL